MEHTILLFMSPGDKTKKQKKQRDYKQLTPTKVQRLGEGGGACFFIVRPIKRCIYIWSHVRQGNGTSKTSTTAWRKLTFVGSACFCAQERTFHSSLLSFFFMFMTATGPSNLNGRLFRLRLPFACLLLPSFLPVLNFQS